MCAGAILQSRLSRIVFGAESPLLGAAGSWVDLFDASRPHPFHTTEVCRLARMKLDFAIKGVVSYLSIRMWLSTEEILQRTTVNDIEPLKLIHLRIVGDRIQRNGGI